MNARQARRLRREATQAVLSGAVSAESRYAWTTTGSLRALGWRTAYRFLKARFLETKPTEHELRSRARVARDIRRRDLRTKRRRARRVEKKTA